MSNLILCNDAENVINDKWVAGVQSVGVIQCELFKSNTTPTATSTYGSFTAADFGGYEPTTISLAPSTTIGGKGTLAGGAIDFVADGSSTNTIYGYLATRIVSGTPHLLWAEKFDSSQVMANNGDTLTITPKFELDSAH